MYLKYQMMMVIIIVITLRKSNKVCNALYEKKKFIAVLYMAKWERGRKNLMAQSMGLVVSILYQDSRIFVWNTRFKEALALHLKIPESGWEDEYVNGQIQYSRMDTGMEV